MAKTPEEKAAYNAHWRKSRREYIRAYQKQWAAKNKDRTRDYYLAQYGLTRADYDALFAVQGNACAICMRTDPGTPTKTWHVDHCHVTRRVRGILCHGCNIGIGHFNDDIARVGAALLYLAGRPAAVEAIVSRLPLARPVRVRNKSSCRLKKS